MLKYYRLMNVSILVLGMLTFAYSSCMKQELNQIEDAIKFEYDALGSNISNGDKFVFTLKLLSAMPTDGVKLDISAKEELTGTVVSQDASVVSKAVQTALSVKNLPQQKWVVVTVTVCSVKTPTNCVTKTFKVVFK